MDGSIDLMVDNGRNEKLNETRVTTRNSLLAEYCSPRPWKHRQPVLAAVCASHQLQSDNQLGATAMHWQHHANYRRQPPKELARLTVNMSMQPQCSATKVHTSIAAVQPRAKLKL